MFIRRRWFPWSIRRWYIHLHPRTPTSPLLRHAGHPRRSSKRRSTISYPRYRINSITVTIAEPMGPVRSWLARSRCNRLKFAIKSGAYGSTSQQVPFEYSASSVAWSVSFNYAAFTPGGRRGSSASTRNPKSTTLRVTLIAFYRNLF